MNGMNVNVGVCLFVEDIEKMVSFYRNIMEFETDWDGGLFAEFKTKSGPLSFFMYDRKNFASAVGESYYPPKRAKELKGAPTLTLPSGRRTGHTAHNNAVSARVYMA